MSPDPYTENLLDREIPYSTKTNIIGRINCVLHARSNKRGLELCPYSSRAVTKNEIHELLLTSMTDISPGKTIDNIAYLGFFQVFEGGVIWVGDKVDIEGRVIGYVSGFDLTHFPNHMNIVIQTREPLQTGKESGVQLKAEITFIPPVEETP